MSDLRRLGDLACGRRRPREHEDETMTQSAGVASKSHASAYLSRLSELIATVDAGEIDNATEVIRAAWHEGRQIITMGNGGSAMTALHFITDWNKGVFSATGRRFRGRSLVDNMGIVSAYANDLSYADVFVEQLRNVADPRDLVIAISGSGNSENVVRAVRYANEIGCETLALVGFSGGRLKDLARHVVWTRVDDMQLAEDLHAVIGHIVMRALMRERGEARETAGHN
jgi:D-sedoheptulose 7-phosphate isomerase